MLDIQKKMSNAFYAILSLPATAMGFALCVQISALSWILSTKYGLDIHDIGIVWAAGPIAGIIAQPLVGLLSDNMWFLGGRRRPWILIGGTLAALMMLALPNLHIIQDLFISKAELAADPTAGLLAIAVIVALTFDISINVSFNPTRSIVADCTTKDDRGKGYTWMQTVSGTFGVLAYFIGGTLGNEALIYIGIGIALLATVIPAFLIEEPRELVAEEDANQVAQAKTSGKDIIETNIPLLGFLVYGVYVIIEKLFGLEVTAGVYIGGFFINIVEQICIVLVILGAISVLMNLSKSNENSHEFQKILLAHSFTWVGVQTMFIFAFFYLKENLNLGEAAGNVNSIAFLILNLVSAILPLFVLNGASKKFGMVKTHAICILIMAFGYGGIYLFGDSSVITYYTLMAIAGIGWASVISLPFAIMSERVDQTKMGLYMGIFNFSVVLPQLVASFKMGQIVNDAENKAIIFGICAVCLLISGVLWFAVKETYKKEDSDNAPKGGH